MKCEEGGVPIASAESILALAGGVELAAQLVELAAHASHAAGDEHDVGENGDPDEPVGDGDEGTSRHVLDRLALDLDELLRERERGQEGGDGQRRERRETAPGETAARETAAGSFERVHVRASNRSSVSSFKVATSARAASSL